MTAPTFSDVENAANAGAFGDNQLPEPTDAQRRAGNYRMGRLSFHGLPIAIENPRGSLRTGTDPDGRHWRCRLAAHYGYFTNTLGADGEGVDVFVGPIPDAPVAYVINQNVGGRFDEHKVVLGAADEDHARHLYRASYAPGWRGLSSIVPLSIEQLKHWLRRGNTRRALTAAPHHQQEPPPMNRVFWNRDAQPEGLSLDQVLYHARIADGTESLLLDAVSVADFLDDSEGVIALDAMVVPVSVLARKMDALKAVMERAGGAVKPLAVQVSEPFRQRGVTNVVAVFELSDGQSVSILFHNPDTTPSRLAPTDELVSWKWMLNKRDVTIVVAPERGVDLNPREVARRIMRLAERNSAAFQRANVKRAERMTAIQSLKAEVAELEVELTAAQRELEAEQILAEDRAANPRPTPNVDRYGQDTDALTARAADWAARISAMDADEALALAQAAELTKATRANAKELLEQVHPDDLDAAAQAVANVESTGDASATTAFEHAGRTIYPTVVAGLSRWAVQAGDAPATGDTLWRTREEAMAEAERMATADARSAEREATERADAEAKAASDAEFAASKLGQYLATLSAMAAGAARKALTALRGVKGVPTAIHAFIESLHAEGRLTVSTEEEDKIKPMSRTAFNRATQREQDAHARKVAEAGKVTRYYVSDYDLGAHAYRYAAWLLEQGVANEGSEPAADFDGDGDAARSELEARCIEIVDAITRLKFRGPFWLTAPRDDLYVVAHGRSGMRLMRAIPHYGNALSSNSPVVRNSNYKGNLLAKEWNRLDESAPAELTAAALAASASAEANVAAPAAGGFAAWLTESAAAASAAEAIDAAAREAGGEVEWELNTGTAIGSLDAAGGAYLEAGEVAVRAARKLLAYFREFIRSDAALALIPPAVAGLAELMNLATGDRMTKADAQRALTKLVDIAINRKGGIELTAEQEREFADFQHDARVIEEYLTKRVRRSGRNLLRTPEMKRAYPEIDNPPAYDSADTDDVEFDADAEWEAMPEEDAEATLDGDFKGHPFRGNQYRRGSRTSGTAVSASIYAKRMSRSGSASEIRNAHRIAHHSHAAAALATTGGSRRYHRSMARLHAKHGGVQAATFDSAAAESATGIIRDGEGSNVGTVILYADGSAGVRDFAGGRRAPVSEDVAPAAAAVAALIRGRADSGQRSLEDSKRIALSLMGDQQRRAVVSGLKGEERDYFVETLNRIAKTFADMPHTYQQDGKGDEAVAYLHFFRGGADWYITERDKSGGELASTHTQAFGLADLFGDGGELGYINLDELAEAGVELDFHWQPKTLAAIRGAADTGDGEAAPAVEDAQPTDAPQTAVASVNALGKLVSKEDIRSDDPDALAKLEAKLAHRAALGELMRNANKLVRKGDDAGLLALGFTEKSVAALKTPDFAGRVGYPDYELSNNSAELGRLRKRIDALRAARAENATGGADADAENEASRIEGEAAVAGESAQVGADKALFQSVIDGTAPNMLEPALADELEAAFLRHEGDAEVAGLFEQAVNAYQTAMLTATASL